MRCRRSGFTFLEIMLVVVIIGILVAIVVPKFGNRAAIARQQSTAMALRGAQTAIEEFNFFYGRYPQNLQELVRPPDPPTGGQAPEFFDNIPRDAWNRPLVYRIPAEVGGRHYDLYSMGGNGVDDRGQGDDITAWRTDEDTNL